MCRSRYHEHAYENRSKIHLPMVPIIRATTMAVVDDDGGKAAQQREKEDAGMMGLAWLGKGIGC